MNTRTRVASVLAGLGLAAGGVLVAAPASAAPIGPCNQPEGIYATSGVNYTVKNCRSTTQNLQLIIVNDGVASHREPCTAVAPASTLSTLNGVADPDAYWSWSYC